MFAFSFAPAGWAECAGQYLPISQNTALFSLLGTTYGGNGQTNFCLPDLRGSAAMHPGQGPGLSMHYLGEVAGLQQHLLTESEIPYHTHTVHAGGLANTASPAGAAWASATATPNQELYGDPASGMHEMPAAFDSNGKVAHNNMMPSLAVHFCIALQGFYPLRP